ncbi:MAG: pyruvate kinase [Sulfurospirillaceae bacterium]|nr:pyruvate kinase [Sulfurospirillaceae bacterium]MCK9545291.1 pyruvate kinase [Sulfurospirillaceae bacterium]
MNKKTKIIATVGPASDSVETLKELISAGVNVFRLNFSHGTHEYHESTLKKIKEAAKSLDKRVGVLQDICGPKIRVEELENEFDLKAGDYIEFANESIIGKKIEEGRYRLSINHPEILKLLKVDELVYLYDGTIKTKVVKVGNGIVAEVINSGKLASNKGVNFPTTKLNLDVITKKDKDDIKWAIKHDIDFIAISFVQRAKDIMKAKDFLLENGGNAQIFAKIEKFDAVENIDEILKVSDGIMVARGDLGIEVPYYKVPSIQKQIIKKANEASKAVITATQMLLSMAQSPTATRAEISDVANAVLDGTDAVMLSEESAIGKNPLNVVQTMAATIKETERVFPYNNFGFDYLDETDMIASSTARLAVELKAEAIMSLTSSGQSAKKMARYRPEVRILAVTHDEKTARSLTLTWGVEPIMVVDKTSLNLMLASVVKKAVDCGFIDIEKTYIATAGYPTGVEGSTNYIRILKKDQIDFYTQTII